MTCCLRMKKELESHSWERIIVKSEDGTWNVNGCCGGGCFVIDDIKHCPFCGSELK